MENKLHNDANEEQISEAAKLQRSPLSGSARALLGVRPVLCMVACMYESGI